MDFFCCHAAFLPLAGCKVRAAITRLVTLELNNNMLPWPVECPLQIRYEDAAIPHHREPRQFFQAYQILSLTALVDRNQT